MHGQRTLHQRDLTAVIPAFTFLKEIQLKED